MIALGASTVSFHNFDLGESLARIRTMGFNRTDIGMIPGFCEHFDPFRAGADDTARLVDMVQSSGLTITTLNIGFGWFNDPSNSPTQVECTKRALRVARDLGCYAITVQAGVRIEAAEWLESARFGASQIAPMADLAEEAGVHLTLQCPQIGSITESIDQVLDYLDMIGDRRIGVTMDTSHTHVLTGDIRGYIAVLGDRIGHVHLRDARGGDILVRPGDGEINFGAVMADLAGAGYSRVAALELAYPGDLSADELEQEFLRSRAHLEEVGGSVSQAFKSNANSA